MTLKGMTNLWNVYPMWHTNFLVIVSVVLSYN